VEIAFRVDASATIGLGHFRRCISLAQELRGLRARVVFIVRQLGVDCRSLLDSLDIRCIELPAPHALYESLSNGDRPLERWAGVPWLDDAQETVTAAASVAPDWIVVDHYSFDARWHSYVHEHLSVRVAVIDDLADRPLFASVLIDHNLAQSHQRKYSGLLTSHTRLLTGPRFALIDGAFLQAAKYAFRDRVQSIGIFMGGVDRANLSSVAIRACREVAAFEGAIEVVTTRFNPNIQELRDLCALKPATSLRQDLPNLAGFLSRHDLQIGAGGGAVWERAIAGAPSLLLVAADNQRAGVMQLREAGAAATLESVQPPTPRAVGAAVSRLIENASQRQELSVNSRQLVDGLGARRVAACLLRTELSVRLAAPEDSAIMHQWRNDSRTRAVSRNTREIDLQTHMGWVKNSLVNSERCLLIGAIGALRVGVIRFDRSARDEAEVSLYLDPELHGLGLGAHLLRSGEEYIAHLGDYGSRIVAIVRRDNLSSQRLFASAGYRYHSDRWEKTIDLHGGDGNEDC
jgi:UDP-2,4-diacetamido-2,4,6-trideoxy-beta-L-altropyranose hydrolase